MIGKVTLKVEGINIAKTLENIKKEYEITNINRVHTTTTFLTVKVNSYLNLIAYLKQKCYNVNVVRFSLFLKLFVFMRKFWLQLSTILICFAVLCTLFCVVLGTNFKQDDELCNKQIEEVLKNEGVFGTFKTNVNTQKLEQTILKEVDDLSLIDISFVGCFLNVNYTKKTKPTENQAHADGPIVAQSDGLVSRVFVVSGTLVVSVGSYVLKGQTLIENYFVDKDGNTVPCEAKGDVFVSVWDSFTTTFCENSVVYVPTGREVCSSSIICFGNKIESKTPTIEYEFYETKTEQQNLTNFAVPLKIEIIHYQETIPQKVFTNFEEKVESLKLEAKENLITKINPAEILEEKYTISTVADVYFVTYYAKSEKLIT